MLESFRAHRLLSCHADPKKSWTAPPRPRYETVMHRKKKVKVRWVRTETSRDLDAWEYREGDRVLIELERTRPSRYHGNGVSGLVTDMDSPASWSATLWNVDDNYEDHALAKGLSANDAKKAALALYLSPENMRKAANRVAAKIAPNGIGGAA